MYQLGDRQVPLPPHAELHGMSVRDRHGIPVGRVEGLYVERASGEVRYLGVSLEPVVHGQVLVPIDYAMARDDPAGEYLTVPYSAERLRSAPLLRPGWEPTVSLEGEIHSHFERTPYWDVVRARQTSPAPTPEIALADALAAAQGASDLTVHDARRTAVEDRQNAPAPTTRIADAEVEAALLRGEDPNEVRIKRWST